MPAERSTSPLRERILREALDLLDTAGVGALTVRNVAARSGCSTIGVYTHFGGKEGLVEAILREAFADFEAAVAVVDGGTPDRRGDGVERLVRGAHAYRAWVVANPSRYRLMFSPGPGTPAVGPEVRAEGGRSLTAHERRVQAALDAGELRPGEVSTVAAAVWAHVHGWVMLELTGALRADGTDVDATFDAYVRALFDGLTAR